MQIGDIISVKGFVTRQINLQGQTLIEIEQRLGYHRGRLSLGAYFLVAQELPQGNGFDLAGYSQVASHRTEEKYGDINNQNDPALARKRNIASGNWGLTGSDRLVKVIPITRHDESMSLDEQYPPGSGIPQWKLTKEIKFQVEDIVLNYPSGRFIPKQGYQAVKYF